MYSLVMMSALATGGDAPSFNWGSGCYGGSCSGVVVSSGCSGYAVPVGCCGGTVASCYGGCGGRSLFPLFPNLRARLSARFSRGGSSCVGSSCYGSSCVGSSCHGSSCVGSSCHGSSCVGSSCLGYGFGGCVGSSHGSGYNGGGYYAGSVPGGAGYGSSAPGGVYYLGNSPGVSAATFGYGFAGLPTFPQGYSMGGCYGTGAVGPYYYGADFNNPPIMSVPPVIPQVPMPPATPDMNNESSSDGEFQASRAVPSAAPARLTVELPAAAVLFVDGEKVSGTGTTRNFHTPTLPAGTFFYDLKAVVTVDGEPVTESVRVMVKAGDAKTETFGRLIAAVKSGKSPALVSK